MRDLIKAENFVVVDGRVYFAAPARSRDVPCTGCAFYPTCQAGVSCCAKDRSDGVDVVFRLCPDVVDASPASHAIRDGWRLLWPDEPSQIGDESFLLLGWSTKNIGTALKGMFSRRRRI